MQTMASNSFVELTQRLIEVTKNWVRRRISVTALDSEGLSCVAHELGISAAELRALAHHDKNAADLLEDAKKHLRAGDVVLIMSNGSFDGIHKKLAESFSV